MAALVGFALPGATPTQLATAEQSAQERGAAAGGLPYPGLMFVVITQADGGYQAEVRLRSHARPGPVRSWPLGRRGFRDTNPQHGAAGAHAR